MFCNHLRKGGLTVLKMPAYHHKPFDIVLKLAKFTTAATNQTKCIAVLTQEPAVSAPQLYTSSAYHSSIPRDQNNADVRLFSTISGQPYLKKCNPVQVEKLVKRTGFSSLTPVIVKQIKEDFKAVDLNNDGKIDSHEFKQLLRKYKPAFSESEILEIAELYYVGNSGKAVPFDKLLESIDNTLAGRENTLNVGSCAAEYYYDLNHHQWKEDEMKSIALSHFAPQTWTDKIAYSAVKLVRKSFDTATGWNHEISPKKVLQRVIFLETIAAVPGMTAAIIRHFKSLRNMERDGGLINMFLEEATNERMHLLTFVTMRDPSLAFRASVIGSQFAFGTGFLLAYLASPTFCHRFVGYIEEEAVCTYTKIISAIEKAPAGSDLAKWRMERAPKIGISYWHLGEEGTVLDLMYAVRADEAEHRDVNHSVVGMKAGEVNPRYDPSLRLDHALKRYVREMMTRSPKEEPS